MKRIKKYICFICLIACLSATMQTKIVNAGENGETNITYIGSNSMEPRGMYLQTGISQISKIGSGWIRAAGTTDAQRETTVSVYVRVERFVNGAWEVFASWSANKVGTSVTAMKDLLVPKGYYYRVHCNHYAGPDASSSYTDGMFIN